MGSLDLILPAFALSQEPALTVFNAPISDANHIYWRGPMEPLTEAPTSRAHIAFEPSDVQPDISLTALSVISGRWNFNTIAFFLNGQQRVFLAVSTGGAYQINTNILLTGPGSTGIGSATTTQLRIAIKGSRILGDVPADPTPGRTFLTSAENTTLFNAIKADYEAGQREFVAVLFDKVGGVVDDSLVVSQE